MPDRCVPDRCACRGLGLRMTQRLWGGAFGLVPGPVGYLLTWMEP